MKKFQLRISPHYVEMVRPENSFKICILIGFLIRISPVSSLKIICVKVGRVRRWYRIRLPVGGEFVDDPVPEGQDVDEIVIGKFVKKKFHGRGLAKKGGRKFYLFVH